MDQVYLNEVLAENQFDADFTAHQKGEFYPVPWLITAERASADFWSAYRNALAQHGVKATTARLQGILRERGLSMIATANEARTCLSDEDRVQLILSNSEPRTRFFKYLYETPGSFFLRDSTSFMDRLPDGVAVPPGLR